jgi:hypothetical protein
MQKKTSHFAILFFFLLLSVFLTLGRVGTAFDSFALLNPDLGVYATIAAAQDHPALFTRDPFLSNEKNINSYNMVHVPLLMALNKVFGNYGTACAFLIPFLIFLHLTGYYLLGVSIFKDPWIGLFVSLLISAPTVTFYDFWGLILDALPRFLYQSLIPFVLVLSMQYGKDPKWWPVILGGVGALNYIHPLSTPPWAVAIVLGLWVSAAGVPRSHKIRSMLLSASVLLLILLPFAANYVKSTIIDTSDAGNYAQTLSILQSRFSTMVGGSFLAPITVFFARGFSRAFDWVWYLTWLLGIWGLIFGLLKKGDFDQTIYLRQLAAWMIGILLVSGFVPSVERTVFAYFKQLPPEFEISRTMRYLVPLILLAAVYALKLIADHLHQRKLFSSDASQKLFMGAALTFLLIWGAAGTTQRPDLQDALRQNAGCWARGHLVCDLPPIHMDFVDVMNGIRDETPLGARILSEGQEVAIRYYALRPLVFTYKDGAPLAYTDEEQLLQWNRMWEEMDKLTFLRKFPFRHRAFVRGMAQLAESADADYLLLQEPYGQDLDYPEQLKLVYSNNHYSLFEINGE